tara:strand:+ start:7600 stop:8064 length:465 start_codon:yes stop_codon:yes gene_type:complete
MTESQKSNRSPRSVEKRENEVRNQDWTPANLLPDPHPKDGISFKWIRVSSMGVADPTNYSKKIREGWQPVPIEEVPELAHLVIDPNPKFEGKLEVGGLLLCKMPSSMTKQRNDHYLQNSKDAQSSVDNNLMKESNPRMPMDKPTNTSRVSFGRG